MYRGKEIPFTDFSGGLVTNRPITELKPNEASDLDNVVIFAKGKGFRSRYGDTVLNSSAMNSGVPIQGLGYLKLVNTNEYLVAVVGAKVFATGAGITGTMGDITGTLTISAGQDKIWSFTTFNNKIIGFGGVESGLDTPFVWTGTGNATALGGTPPSAYHGFQTNNRIFAFRTTADPSTIFWSVLSNEGDWTGAGSGSADVYTSDNDVLTASAILNTNTVLLFKENSVHQMQTGSLIDGAFPIYPLFSGVGCAGKHACLVVDGLVYFITPQGKMKVTDGVRIYDEKDFPALVNIDDQWQTTNSSRWKYTQGIRKIGKDYDHILWSVSYGTSQTTHNRVFIWDLLNKCWLQNTTGYNANCFATTQSGILYSGEYAGKIYKKDSSTSTFTDASSGSVIDGYFTSGWLHSDKFETIKQFRKFNLSYVTQATGNIRIAYGFDFNGLTSHKTIFQGVSSGVTFDSPTAKFDISFFSGVPFGLSTFHLTGRGNFFQYKIESPIESSTLQINGFTLSGKEYGQKEFTAS
jgi:hypothetical protein